MTQFRFARLENSKTWLIPVLLCIIATGAMLVFLPSWSWSLFDEIGWFKFLQDGVTVKSFMQSDYSSWGRFRPLSPFFAFGRIQLFGPENIKWMRVERYAEFLVLLGLFWSLLRKRENISLALSVFALGFLLKSPPILELIRVVSLSELAGMIFVLAGLLIRERSLAGCYAFLFLAVITKEPFALFLPMPALLDRRVRETFITGLIGAGYLGFLMAMRKGGYYEVGSSAQSMREILLKLAVDLVPALSILVFWIHRFRFKGTSIPSDLWRSGVFFVFAGAYAGVLLGKAAAYGYHFAPSVLLTAWAFTLLIRYCVVRFGMPKLAFYILVFFAAVQPLRLVWNIGRLYNTHRDRFALTEAVRESKISGTYGTNCYLDSAGLGYVANARKESGSCTDWETNSVKECCKKVSIVGLLAECPSYEHLLSDAKVYGFPIVAQGEGWKVISCQRH